MDKNLVWGLIACILIVAISGSIYLDLHSVAYEHFYAEPSLDLLANKPKQQIHYAQSGNTEGTILMLLPPAGHYRTGQADGCLPLLEKNYLKYHPCDVTFLIEGDFGDDEKKKYAHMVPSARTVIFSPWGVNAKEIPADAPEDHKKWMQSDEVGNGWPLGYKKMCRFFAGEVFYHPALANYKYYLRLDTDSLILEPVPYDFFERMKQTKCTYGYRFLTGEGAPFTNDIWKTFRGWQAHQNLSVPDDSWLWRMVSPRYDLSEYFGLMFYNNFEVVDIDWFKNYYYQSYFQALVEAGGFFRYRWGDAPLRTLGVAFMMPPEQVCLFSGFCYNHQGDRCTKEGVPILTDFGDLKPPNIQT